MLNLVQEFKCWGSSGWGYKKSFISVYIPPKNCDYIWTVKGCSVAFPVSIKLKELLSQQQAGSSDGNICAENTALGLISVRFLRHQWDPSHLHCRRRPRPKHVNKCVKQEVVHDWRTVWLHIDTQGEKLFSLTLISFQQDRSQCCNTVTDFPST